MFDPYTELLVIGSGIGGALGAIAALVRRRGTVFEDKNWVVGLGAVAGGVLGGVVFLSAAALAATFDYFSDRSNSRELFVPAFLTLLVLFAFFVLRRR